MIQKTVLLESYNLGEKEYSEDLAGRFWAEVLQRNFKKLIILTRSKTAKALFPDAEVHSFEALPRLPQFLRKLKLGRPRSYFNYVSWLYRSARRARAILRRQKVDFVIHASWSSLLIGTRIRPEGARLVMSGCGLDTVPNEFVPYMSPADRIRQRLLTAGRGARPVSYTHLTLPTILRV